MLRGLVWKMWGGNPVAANSDAIGFSRLFESIESLIKINQRLHKVIPMGEVAATRNGIAFGRHHWSIKNPKG